MLNFSYYLNIFSFLYNLKLAVKFLLFKGWLLGINANTALFYLCYVCPVELGLYHRYTPEIPEPAPSWSQHGAPSYWGSSGFPCNQNNHGSSGAYVTASTAVWVWRLNTHKTAHGARILWTRRFCICFCISCQQNPKTPNWAPLLTTPLYGAV